MNKKICFTLSLVFLLVVLTLTAVQAAEDTLVILKIDNPTMLVDGTSKEIDPGNGTTPVLVNGSTLVPIRAIIESMGGTVEWTETEKKVTVSLNGKVVEVWLDKNTARVNGLEQQVRTAPTAINDRTLLPLRFVSENLGLCVNWEESTQCISISRSSDYFAIIAGEKLSNSEFNFFLGRAKEDIGNYILQNQLNNNQTGSLWDTVIDGKEARELVKEQALSYAREFKYFSTKVKESNVSFSSEENKNLDNSINQMVADQGGIAEMEKTTKSAYDVSLLEYLSFYKDYMLINKYIEEAQKEIQIPEDEINKFYESNKERIDKVTVKHILLSTVDQEGKPLPEDKQEEAKKKAEEVLEKVKAGGDFAALAKEYSQDPGSKDTGGQYTFGRGEMVKEFEDWSFAAKTGDVGIVKTAYGYHVMKFEQKTGLEQVKTAIRDTLANQIFAKNAKEGIEDPQFTVIKNQSRYDTIKIVD